MADGRNAAPLIVGQVYQVDPRIKICWNGMPARGPRFLKLIGFSSKRLPVFQDGDDFFAVDPNSADITPITTTS